MRRAIFAALGTIVGLVLLLTFKTQSATAPAQASGVTGPPSSGNSSPSSGAGSGSGGDTSSRASSSGSGTKTVTGAAADTRYGPVQVRITVTDGKITSAEAVDYPQNEPRDQEINSWAVPQLNSEAISANSADIDVVSGATYTSEGYAQSLQSALDRL